MMKIIKRIAGVLLIVMLISGCSESKISTSDKARSKTHDASKVQNQNPSASKVQNQNPNTDKVQNKIEFWEQKTSDKSYVPSIFYHLYSGERYEIDKWTAEKPNDSADYFIGEEVRFWIDNKTGSYFEMVSSSPAGDWSIISKNYYGTDNKLELVFWKMNTTQSLPGALTIERQFTFDNKSVLTNKSESVYQMNTKTPVKNPDFMDHEAGYWTSIDSLPFKDLVK